MKKRNHFVDISKGLAIIMVTVTHYSWESAERLQWYFPYWISMAVPIFMIVTGVMSAASFERRGVETLQGAYAPRLLVQKKIRYTMPFLCMFIAEVVLEWMRGHHYHPVQLCKLFITGGIGVHGTYYYPVLMQLIFLIPVIWYIVKKWKWGIATCFLFNLILEYWKNVIGMGREEYRLMAFRYIFAIAMGCFIHIYKDKKMTWTWILMWFVGVSYIWKVNYTDYKPEILNRWTNTSMMTILYMAPIFVFGMKKLSQVKCKWLETIGKASYHIFLFQIIYYNFVGPYVMTWIGSRAAELVVSVAMCLAGGYGFYRVYNYVSEKVTAWYAKHKLYMKYRFFGILRRTFGRKSWFARLRMG